MDQSQKEKLTNIICEWFKDRADDDDSVLFVTDGDPLTEIITIVGKFDLEELTDHIAENARYELVVD